MTATADRLAPSLIGDSTCMAAEWRRIVLDDYLPDSFAEITARAALGHLSPGQRRVAALLADHADVTGRVRYRRREHAAQAGVCKGTATKTVGQLIAAGLVARVDISQRRHGEPDELRLILPTNSDGGRGTNPTAVNR